MKTDTYGIRAVNATYENVILLLARGSDEFPQEATSDPLSAEPRVDVNGVLD